MIWLKFWMELDYTLDMSLNRKLYPKKIHGKPQIYTGGTADNNTTRQVLS